MTGITGHTLTITSKDFGFTLTLNCPHPERTPDGAPYPPCRGERDEDGRLADVCSGVVLVGELGEEAVGTMKGGGSIEVATVPVTLECIGTSDNHIRPVPEPTDDIRDELLAAIRAHGWQALHATVASLQADNGRTTDLAKDLLLATIEAVGTGSPMYAELERIVRALRSPLPVPDLAPGEAEAAFHTYGAMGRTIVLPADVVQQVRVVSPTLAAGDHAIYAPEGLELNSAWQERVGRTFVVCDPMPGSRHVMVYDPVHRELVQPYEESLRRVERPSATPEPAVPVTAAELAEPAHAGAGA